MGRVPDYAEVSSVDRGYTFKTCMGLLYNINPQHQTILFDEATLVFV